MLRIKFCTKQPVGEHVYLPKSGARWLERLICFEYYTVLKWASKFRFGLNAVEIANYIKKLFKYKLLRIKFSIKKSWAHMSVFLKSETRRLQRLICFKYYTETRKIRFLIFTILPTPDSIMLLWHHQSTKMENTTSESGVNLLCIGFGLFVPACRSRFFMLQNWFGSFSCSTVCTDFWWGKSLSIMLPYRFLRFPSGIIVASLWYTCRFESAVLPMHHPGTPIILYQRV